MVAECLNLSYSAMIVWIMWDYAKHCRVDNPSDALPVTDTGHDISTDKHLLHKKLGTTLGDMI